ELLVAEEALFFGDDERRAVRQLDEAELQIRLLEPRGLGKRHRRELGRARRGDRRGRLRFLARDRRERGPGGEDAEISPSDLPGLVSLERGVAGSTRVEGISHASASQNAKGKSSWTIRYFASAIGSSSGIAKVTAGRNHAFSASCT